MLNHDNRTKRYLHKVFCLMRCVIGDYICIFTKNRKFRNISRNLDVNVPSQKLNNIFVQMMHFLRIPGFLELFKVSDESLRNDE